MFNLLIMDDPLGFSSSNNVFLALDWLSRSSCCWCWHLIAIFPQLNLLDDLAVVPAMLVDDRVSLEAVVLTPLLNTLSTHPKYYTLKDVLQKI